MDVGLHIANGITNVIEIIVQSLLQPLKVSGHLSEHLLAVLPKLNGESLIGIKRSRRSKGRSKNSRYDRLVLRSRSTLPNTYPLEKSVVYIY